MRSRRRPWLLAATVVYLAGALVVGFWPTPVDRDLRGLIARALGVLHRGGLPNGYGYDALEFSANIAFFVPIGVLLCLVFARRLWLLAILCGALLSGVIELGQLLFLSARFASWQDVEANTIGTAIGVTIVLIARGIRALARASRVSGASRAKPAAR